MKKYLPTLVFILLGYILPLLGRVDLLLHYKLHLLLLACIIIFMTQPRLNIEEAQNQKATDQNSFFIIFILSLVGITAPIIEWAYFNPTVNGLSGLVPGLIILAVGILLRFWAIRILGRFFTLTVQVAQDHALVKSGPYALIRHPSYFGAFLAFVGSAIILEAWWGLLIAIIAMLIAYSIRIKSEEIMLVSTFGAQYERYQTETKKMIPFVW